MKEYNKMFFDGEGIIVGELYFAVEVLAAAFGAEVEHMLMFFKLFGVHMAMMMVVLAMFAELRSVAKAAHQTMVLATIVEVDVPAHGNEEHQQCHSRRYYLKEKPFHAAKVHILSELYINSKNHEFGRLMTSSMRMSKGSVGTSSTS